VNTFEVKVTLTPLLIAAASLAQRRWGGAIGGLIAGLPLTSAPVSLFLAIEHGPDFAAHAATGTLLGITAMSAFCVGYARVADRSSWWRSASFGLAVCLTVTFIASQLPQTFTVAALVTFPALAVLIKLFGEPDEVRAVGLTPPWWDIPARMLVATAIVLLITEAANALGAKWSGLLSTLPVYALVMGVFSHTHSGPAAARSFLRGVAIGAIGAAAFLAVVIALVQQTSLRLTYVAATLASIGLAAITQALLTGVRRRTSDRSADQR
jgi:F0F1-type ATP synthase assembly protein I